MLEKSHKKWKELATGKIALQTDNIGLQMFLKRSAVKLSAQGATPAEVAQSIEEIHNFFVKYERILQKEIALISK